MLSFCEMSWFGGIFILIILFIRSIFKKQLPKFTYRLLWIIAMIRLILPFRLDFSTSAYQLIERTTLPSIRVAGLLEMTNETANLPITSQPSYWLGLIWFMGTLTVATYFLTFHLRSQFSYRVSLPVNNLFIQSWLERNRLRRPIQVRMSDRIGSPLTYGILWPVILLPKSTNWENEQSLGYILAHETTHIRYFDVLLKWCLLIVLCLHWFNPFVWIMYGLACQDLECCCDEAVVKKYGHQSRGDYAMTLVEMEERRACFTPLTNGFSKSDLHQRVITILHAHPITTWQMIISTVLVLFITLCFATNAPKKSVDSPSNFHDKVETVVYQHEEPSYYTQAEYNQLVQLVQPTNYQDMSIAEFNRIIYAKMNEEDSSDNWNLYEKVLQDIPEKDPLASYFSNTVQASLNEYTCRLEEAYSNQRNDPEFYGYAEVQQQKTVLQQEVITLIQADYSFHYRILQQDKLTVGQRDQFLQQVMQTAQLTLQQQADLNTSQLQFEEELNRIVQSLSNEKIELVDFTVNNLLVQPG